MSEHALTGSAVPVQNARGQWAAHCRCGHVAIGLFPRHAEEYIVRHVADPKPHETPEGR